MATTYYMDGRKQTFHLAQGDKVSKALFLDGGCALRVRALTPGNNITVEAGGYTRYCDPQSIIIIAEDESNTGYFEYSQNFALFSAFGMPYDEGVLIINASSSSVNVSVNIERASDEADVTIIADVIKPPKKREESDAPLTHEEMDANLDAYVLSASALMPYLLKLASDVMYYGQELTAIGARYDGLEERVNELENRLNALEGNSGGGQEQDPNSGQDNQGSDPNGGV